jgi:hypothetical protein
VDGRATQHRKAGQAGWPAGAARMLIEVPSRKLTIGYWACRGLGAPLRMMAAYSQTDYDDKHYEVTPCVLRLRSGRAHAGTSSSARAAVRRCCSEMTATSSAR